jgi:hypothetical protein
VYSSIATVTINPVVGAPSASSATFCGSGSITPTLGANGNTIKWYNALTGGSLVATGTTSPTVSSTTTYYITSYNSTTACETGSRLAVTLTINPAAAGGTIAPLSAFCGSGTVNLSVSGNQGTGGSYEYRTQTGGGAWTTWVSCGSTLSVGPAGDQTVVYEFHYVAVSGTCGSSTSASVTTSAYATSSFAPPVVTGNVHVGAPGPLTLTATGAGDIKWYNSSNVLLQTGAQYITPTLNNSITHYCYATVTASNACVSAPAWVDVKVFGMLIDGSVGIGTTDPGSFKLAVNGKIWATEIQVALTNPGPDYVFEKSYNLPNLEDVKFYIDQNKHLPEVPSAKEMEADGVNVGEMNMLLLKKIEELTLYVIQMNNKMNEMKEENNKLKDRIQKIEHQ